MLSEFNVTINFFELFAKKFAKTGENRLFNNKKTLKSALCKVFSRVSGFKLAPYIFVRSN